MNKTIKIFSSEDQFEFEKWIREQRATVGWYGNTPGASAQELREESVRNYQKSRAELRKRFPHTVVLNGEYKEHDWLRRWCWRNFSPSDGHCIESDSFYPGCPLVLATERIIKDSYICKDGTPYNETYKEYGPVDEHSHPGMWSTYCFGKTGPDMSADEYGFEHKKDCLRFLTAFVAPETWLGFKE